MVFVFKQRQNALNALSAVAIITLSWQGKSVCEKLRLLSNFLVQTTFYTQPMTLGVDTEVL